MEKSPNDPLPDLDGLMDFKELSRNKTNNEHRRKKVAPSSSIFLKSKYLHSELHITGTQFAF